MNIFLNYIRFIKDRRSYQKNWFAIRKKIAFEWSMTPRRTYSNLIFPSNFSHSQDRKNRSGWGNKSGTWKFNALLGRSIWERKYQEYFPAAIQMLTLDSRMSIGGIANDINSLKIFKMHNVVYESSAHKPNGLNMFTFRVYSRFRNLFKKFPLSKIDHALTVEIGGSDSFQHFVQDCLPLLCFLDRKTSLLKTNIVILKRPITGKDSITTILNLMFPNVEFLFLESGSCLSINNLWVPQFSPKNFVFSLPREVVVALSENLISMGNTELKGNSILFLDRGDQKTRNLKNKQQLLTTLNNISLDKGGHFCVLDTTTESLDSMISKVCKAEFIVGVHGGSMYNAIFASKDATVIELIPANNCDSVANLFLDLGVRYLPIMLDFDKSDFEFELPIEFFLKQISKTMQLDENRFK